MIVHIQDAVVVYVDNPFHTSHVLKRSFSSLAKGLHPDDKGVKWDIYHVVELLRGTTRVNHPGITGGHGSCKTDWLPCMQACKSVD